MTIETVDQPDDRITATARAIQQAALEADTTAPFSEQTVLSWAATTDTAATDIATTGDRHLLARGVDGQVVGYGYLDATGSAEFAVHPDHRRQGHGRAMLTRLQVAAEVTPTDVPTRLQVWSHGDHPGARALAEATGFKRVRKLFQMRLFLDETFPEQDRVDPPAGVTVRGFRPGEDDAAWLRLNARAFAHHPEQGRMTQSDLQARMDEPWFDPAGFLLAEQDGVLIGYHWTKVHPEKLGEVYVLGVDPDRHGGGLGRALSQAGLRYLYDRGLRTVLLYVEADNEPALGLYHELGFGLWNVDVQYKHP